MVVVCRGGDCGSQLKHPSTGHATQLRRLREEIDPETATVATSKCLDACDYSNVIVVVPGAAGRAAGEQPVWVGRVLDQDATTDIITWVNHNDPDAEPPPMVQVWQFRPTRQSRRELSDPATIPGYRAT